ncbi:BON domain-containing protein [Bordetella genomosp. 11]|uniref:Osmotically-inducible protein Y n=1 Tax=Bordetella genomosp. 11 TaxID=1416808 RepID=A0A261UJ24_9BORD|nr:BON domain-containing protein [Bordetella genomosp. 11]OZI61625.1 phospholipid-binding protein [Bordetella genomosp. 11]
MRTRQLIIGAILGLSAALPAAHAADNTADGKPKQSVGEYASDTVVTTKVKAAIVADKSLSALDIAVETNNGVVTLTGTVASAAQSDAATHAARGVEGVKQVKNNLKVDPTKAKK